MAQTNSVGHSSSTRDWLREQVHFFRMRREAARNLHGPRKILQRIDQLDALYRKHSGRSLETAACLEIGFGQFPTRLLMMHSLGIDVKGIDLDRPLLKGSISEFAELYRKNGFRRFLKSVVRHYMFDRNTKQRFDAVLRERGHKLKIPDDAFIVGDAANVSVPSQSIDFVFSDDVFEHIPVDQIHVICRNLTKWLKPDGIAVLTPALYSGIAGGHLTEWYPHVVDKDIPRETEAWEHLRKRRVHADCYLNEVRLHEFREIFAQYFDIVEEVNDEIGLGRAHLTPEIREELADYSEEELLSHRVSYVLMQKDRAKS